MSWWASGKMGLFGSIGEELMRGDNSSDSESGSSDRDDIKRQIESDATNCKQIYQLVNVNTGGGKLIELIQASLRKQSSRTISKSQSNINDRGQSEQKQLGVKFSSSKTITDTANSNDSRARLAKRAFSRVAQQTAMGSDRYESPVTGLLEQEERHIDESIHRLVAPLLYNQGRGKLVSLSRLWANRFGIRDNNNNKSGASGDISSSGSVKLDEDGPPSMPNGKGPRPPRSIVGYRWVCWKLGERGFAGETVLHICFHLSTPSHLILAQKLIKLFPMLVNDTCTGDKYFGESSLHMAIVNENIRFVKLLLDGGASVHERCLGTFFLPVDQKAEANTRIRKRLIDDQRLQQYQDVDDDDDDQGRLVNLSSSGRGDERNSSIDAQFDLHSNHFKSLETNYEGYTYWGEYPLSFAASLGLTDCYKLLLAKGADPNHQDSNGNSTLHICVIANRLDMFDLCYSNGANLNLINWLGLSPLALAAKLCRTQMFFHILTIQRHINWVFCNVAFVDYPLAGIDSINTRDGSCNEQSVLMIVTSGNSIEHLAMLDGLIGELLQVKWNTSLRKEFYRFLLKHLSMLVISTLAYSTRLWARDGRNVANNATTTSHIHINSSIPNTSIKLDQISANVSTRAAANSANNINSLFAGRIKFVNQVSELLLVWWVIYFLSITAQRFFIAKTRQHRRRQAAFVAPASGLGSNIEQQQANRIVEAHMMCDHRLKHQIDDTVASINYKIFMHAPEMIIFTFTCLLVLVCIPLRLARWIEAEDSLATIIMFLLPMNSYVFLRASRSIGTFIVMVYKIFGEGLLPVALLVNIFVFGFVQSLFLVMKTYRPRTMMTLSNQANQRKQNGFGSAARNSTTPGRTHSSGLFESIVQGDNLALDWWDMFIAMYMVVHSEFSWMLDEFAATDYPILAKVMLCLFIIIAPILLLNLFIATIGKTYADMSAHPNENLRQWARALLILERLCSPSDRLKMLDNYSHEIKIHAAQRRAAALISKRLATTRAATATTLASVVMTAASLGPRVTAPQDGGGTNIESIADMAAVASSGVQFCRCYSTTWALKEGDWQDIKRIKELKRNHELSIARSLAKSNINIGKASVAASKFYTTNKK